MTKEHLKELLEQAGHRVHVVGVDRDKGRYSKAWRKFQIYIPYNNQLLPVYFTDEDKDTPQYYVKRHKTKSGEWKGGYFENGSIGLDRVVDIVYHFSYWLYKDYYKLKYTFLS